MLLPQVGALVFLALYIEAARCTSSAEGSAKANSGAVAGASEHDDPLSHLSLLTCPENIRDSIELGATSSPVCHQNAPLIAKVVRDNPESSPALAKSANATNIHLHGLVDIHRMVNDVDVEAGAREVITKTGAYIGGPDLSGTEKIFGPVAEFGKSQHDKRYSVASLPKPIAENTLALIHNHRKLEAHLVNVFMELNSKWVRSMRLAANLIKSDGPEGSLSRNTKEALIDLIHCTNTVLINFLQSKFITRAADIYNDHNAEISSALFDAERRRYQAFISGLLKSSHNGKYSTVAAVVSAIGMSTDTAITNIEAEIRLLVDDEEKIKKSVAEKLIGHIPCFRNMLRYYPWITDFDAQVDSRALYSASCHLFGLSDDVVQKSSNFRAMIIRKRDTSDRKISLEIHRKILQGRSVVALDIYHSFNFCASSEIYRRTEAFVIELLSSGEIARALDEEERDIVTIVDKIIGRKHRTIKLAVSNAPVVARWDGDRKLECIARLDALIEPVNFHPRLQNVTINEAVDELDGVIDHFKGLLTERVDLMKMMQGLINSLDERKAVGAFGKRYKAVGIEIDAVKDSIGAKMKFVKELVSKKIGYETSIASNEAAQSVLIPLRSEIAKADSIEAVNRIIAKAAESANHQENRANSETSAQTRQISFLSNNAKTARLTWLDLISRILTHTHRLEEILKTAFKVHRTLDEGELRQTGIRLENMVKITADILANIDLEKNALAEMRAAEISQAIANARAAAFSKLSTQSRLKAIIFGETNYNSLRL